MALPHRLVSTRRNVNNYEVVRIGGILAEPQEFRQTLHSSVIPAVAYCGIERRGLRISTNPSTAQWGEGAYVWPARLPLTGLPWIDVEAPAGILVEELRVNGQGPFYRLLPLAGNFIPVRVIGTNIPPQIIAQFRPLANLDD